MTASDTAAAKPLWLSIEEKILALDSQELSSGNLEPSIQRIAGELDDAGYKVSKLGGNMLALRFAIDAAAKVGHPLLQDLNKVVDAYTLEDVADAYAATNSLIDELRATWPGITKANNRADVINIVQNKKLDLLVAKAKSMPDDTGIRMLLEEEVAGKTIIKTLEITQERLDEVKAAVAAELKEKNRILGLLEKVEGKSEDEKVRHLFANEVAEDQIVSIAGIDQAVIDGVKKAMEEEIKEKERLAAEAAAKKKAEAEGPALEDISPEDMADHIEAIREIQEFSDEEKDIRVMCEQSAIPKALVDLVFADPAKFDELEKQAEG
jgi:hypothetical protein